MKLTIEQILEHAYVISIDNKQLQYFYTVMNLCGFDEDKINFFHGRTDGQTGAINCTNSHLDIIKLAKNNNWDMITVFEDDTFPSKNFNMCNFNYYLKNIPNDAVGICYSRSRGDFSQYNKSYIDKRIHKNRLSASNFYTIFRNGYDEVIKNLERKRAADIAINIDKFYYTKDNLFVQCSYGNRMSSWSILNPKTEQERWCSQFLDRDFYDRIYKFNITKRIINTKQIKNELKTILSNNDNFIYRFNGGNIGDAFIGYSETQLFKELNLKYQIISKTNKEKLTSKEFTLVYGGGGGWIDKYISYGMKQVNFYFKNKNLKKCIILPSTFYKCDEVINSFDERFIVFCRDTRSFEYCKAKNKKAKFILHDDLAFCSDIKYLNLNNLNGIKDHSIFKDIHEFRIKNKTSCNLLRNDSERTNIKIPSNNLDISELKKLDGENMTVEYVTDFTRLLLYFIDKYEKITTNRLHVAIASYRLNKDIILYDNSYGKVKDVYNLSLNEYKKVLFKNQ